LVSDPNADLDLYLYQVVKGVAVLRAKSDSSSATEGAVIDRPGAGPWKVVVYAYRILGGSTEYTYEDSFFHNAFGNVTVEDKEAERGLSAEWDVNAKTKILASPQAGRFIVGNRTHGAGLWRERTTTVVSGRGRGSIG